MIHRNRSIVIACDVEFSRLEDLVKETYGVPFVGGYKVGALLAMEVGLSRVVNIICRYTDKPIIYDHQKAGNDIPDLGKKFMGILRSIGIDAVILFPFVGPISQKEWIYQAFEHNITPIVGSYMTHDGFSDSIRLGDSVDVLNRAMLQGVEHFVLPANKCVEFKLFKHHLEVPIDLTFPRKDIHIYSPGLVTQGGSMTDVGSIAGKNFHAIIGRAVYDTLDPIEALYSLWVE